MIRFLLLPLTAVLLTVLPAVAQRSGGYLSGIVVDSSLRTPLSGAAVAVASKSDTIHVKSDGKGAFRAGPLNDTLVRVDISYVGYMGRTQRVRMPSGNVRLDTVALQQAPYTMEDVVIEGERPLMSQDGDTIVYHADNIRVLPGDEAGQIVMRLPGMEVKEGTVKYMGKTIERTYVDGKPLFGENAQSALDYLQANDVVDIRVYDELPEEEAMKGNKNGKKRTVMNIITRSKPQKSINIEALASYGADIDAGAEGKHKGRYGAGASYNYFSEQKVYAVSVNSNNNNQGSNRMRNMMASFGGNGAGDRRNTSVGAWMTRRWGKKLTLFGNYNYSNNYTKTKNITEQVYFPTAEYASRQNNDTTHNASRSQQHQMSLRLRYQSKTDFADFSPNFQITRSDADYFRNALNTLNGETINRVRSTNRNNDQGHNVGGNISWRHAFEKNPRRNFNISASGTTSRNDASGWRIDSLASDNGRTVLETTGAGWSNRFGGGVGYEQPLGDSSSLSVSYNLSYENSKSLRMAVDPFTGRIDTTQTYDYTRNYTTQSGGVGFSRYKSKYYLAANVNFQSSRLNKDEAFPELRNDRHIFQSVLPAVSFNYRPSPKKNLYANYSCSASAPSVEQLRNELNTQNVLNLSGGNPGLRQSYSQNLSIGMYNTNPETSRSFGFYFSASMTSRAITTRSVFFTEDTPLPEYNNYVAPKGSTLTTPVNVDGSWSANLNGYYSTPIKKLGTTFNIGGGIGYNRRPTYIKNVLDYTNSVSPSFFFVFYSNKSVVYQYSLFSNTSYNHSANSMQDDNSTITQNVGLNLQVNFLKRLYCATNYNFMLTHNFAFPDNSVSTNRWNLSLGCKLLKKRQLDLNFTVFDLLNRNNSFTTSMMADYITNSWTQMFGRYFSFSAGFRFNKTGKLKRPPKTQSEAGPIRPMIPMRGSFGPR